MSSEHKKISVITVVRNAIDEGRMEAAQKLIQSVNQQTSNAFEYIVWDGNSTDGTVELFQNNIAPSVEYQVISERDAGIYDAMNRAAARATGDYLLFINSDDCLFSDTSVGDLVDVARYGRQADLICASVEVTGGAKSRQENAGFMLARVFSNIPVCHQGLAVRRDVFTALGGFRCEYPVAADYDLVLRLLLSGSSWVRTRVRIAKYRAGGFSSDDRLRNRDHAMIWRDLYPPFVTFGETDAAKNLRRRSLGIPKTLSFIFAPGLPWRARALLTAHLARGVQRSVGTMLRSATPRRNPLT